MLLSRKHFGPPCCQRRQRVRRSDAGTVTAVDRLADSRRGQRVCPSRSVRTARVVDSRGPSLVREQPSKARSIPTRPIDRRRPGHPPASSQLASQADLPGQSIRLGRSIVECSTCRPSRSAGAVDPGSDGRLSSAPLRAWTPRAASKQARSICWDGRSRLRRSIVEDLELMPGSPASSKQSSVDLPGWSIPARVGGALARARARTRESAPTSACCFWALGNGYWEAKFVTPSKRSVTTV